MTQTDQPNQEVKREERTITNTINTKSEEITKARSRVTTNTPAHEET
jgi:hypothetical protein